MWPEASRGRPEVTSTFFNCSPYHSKILEIQKKNTFTQTCNWSEPLQKICKLQNFGKLTTEYE